MGEEGSRRNKIVRVAGLALGLIIVGIQFVPVHRTNPPVVSEVSAPAEVISILRRACYDCHSNETAWPWYSHVAPASWFVAHHVEDGRADLNFSDWPTLDLELQESTCRDIEEQVSRGRMPLRSYTLLHPEARLSPAERDTLQRWARSRQVGGDLTGP